MSVYALNYVYGGPQDVLTEHRPAHRAFLRELHERGVAHSVEVWTPQGRLAGGLYGISIGGLFAGESMFHDRDVGRDASKVALMRLVAALQRDGQPDRLIDVQWSTDHLASLGVIEIDREEYLATIEETLVLPTPDWAAENELEENGA